MSGQSEVLISNILQVVEQLSEILIGFKFLLKEVRKESSLTNEPLPGSKVQEDRADLLPNQNWNVFNIIFGQLIQEQGKQKELCALGVEH